MNQELPFSLIEIRLPKSSEKTPEAAAQLFAAFSSLPRRPLLSFKPPVSIAFEIVAVDQSIHFLIVCPKDWQGYVESQVSAQYPESIMTILPKDYLAAYLQSFTPSVGQLALKNNFYLPLRTYQDLKEADLLSSVLGTMSKANPTDFMACQILIAQPGNWQGFVQGLIDKGIPAGEEKVLPHPQAKQMSEKIGSAGFWTAIRLLTNSAQTLKALANSFSTYQSDVNALDLKEPHSFQRQKLITACLKRAFEMAPPNQVLNLEELASLWHPPGKLLSGIKNIAWTQEAMSEPPPNLPTAVDIDEADKKEINFFGRTEFKNRIATFGIKKKDRRRHIYVIGKSGTGKSTLIANMAINDLRNKWLTF